MTESELLRKIQICSFACCEAALYLDTHPTDKEAISYFNKHNNMLKEYRDEYSKKFGPLEQSQQDSDTWRWSKGPWPWEYNS